MYDDKFMEQAIALSRTALTTPGTEPFAAVVVRNGEIVGEGVNHSKVHHDPTSHGEIEAIRDAGRRLRTVDLSDCELYSSCEPCAMCVAALVVAGISKLYYAADLRQSGEAFAGIPASKRHPIDVNVLRAEAGAPLGARRMPSEQHRAAEAVAVLKQWATQ